MITERGPFSTIEDFETTKSNMEGDFQETSEMRKEQALGLLRGRLQALARC